ncbi:hypothetical protein [Muriicola sp. Z0-33]|uniref:hypothetical protein n=1 Tax=Muriicola sp. Z0-33 TaxID=2816957 RepID=UPI002238E8BC|nr:hypothetical protein [Muriicola sp. Z0-33]
MTKTNTNVLGIIIVILAGIYFYISYCGSCLNSNETATAKVINSTEPITSDLALTEWFTDGNKFGELHLKISLS